LLGFTLFNSSFGSSFSYDKNLIKEFKKDHKKLVKILTKIENGKDATKIKELFIVFRTEILGHLLSEDIRLYNYLREHYQNDQNTLTLILEYEKSIKDIQKTVLSFIEFYTQDNVKFDNLFKNKLNNIIEALLSRIETEEKNLYTLYVK